MTPRAITPLFRCLENWCPTPGQPGVEVYPAPAGGNHSGEAWFLALATALLTATAVVPATAGLGSAWLRVPVVAGLIFLLPHLVMAVVSWISPWLARSPLRREAAQDWSCLMVMTGYAALRASGGGWAGVICQGWLAFAAANLLLWGLGQGRQIFRNPGRTAPPAPEPVPSVPPV